MKPRFDLPRLLTISSATTMLCLLSACGQRGPLYLPSPPPAAPAATPAPAAAPAAAPASAPVSK